MAMPMAGQPRWLRTLLALCAALLPVLTVLQGMGLSAARDAKEIVRGVEPALNEVSDCVHQLGDDVSGGVCSLDQVVGQVRDVSNRVGQLPGQLGRLSPGELQRLLDAAIARGVRIPPGPPGPPGTPGAAGPAAAPPPVQGGAAPGATTTTAAPTTTTTAPRPTTTTTAPRTCVLGLVCR